MKRITPLLLLLLWTIPNFAISPKLKETNKIGCITGFIEDNDTNKAIEYATVSVFDLDRSKLIDGTITNENGFFKIKKLNTGNYYIEISFIGYDKKTVSNIAVRSNKKENNLNTIKLSHSNKTIDEVVVKGEQNAVDYKIDRKVINVSKQLSAEGGTAIDVLETAPSVSVDGNGNINLRGSSSFTVLIDGRPSIRSAQDVLSQTPSSQIENIEIITNPSAKYDPEGTAGIINIISKKHRLKGASAFVNLTPGSHDNNAASGMFNLKNKTSNFKIGADYKEQALSGKREIYKTLLNTNPEQHLDAVGDLEQNVKSYSVFSGYNFEIDSLNLFSINATLGHSTKDNIVDLIYKKYTTGVDSELEKSNEKAESETDYYETTFNYLRKFKKKGHQLNTFVDYSGRIYEKTIVSDNLYDSFLEEDASGIVITSDYTLPLSGKNKFEAGFQYINSEYNIDRSLKENNIPNTKFNQSSDYNKILHSLYSMYSGKLSKINYQVGLRTEHLDREIKYDGDTYKINRWDFFPSVHTQMKLGKVSKLSANYSRRINRPSSSKLEGFVVWNDRYNRTKGNPNLKPELINSFELQYNTKLGKHSLSFESYYRMKEDKIERIKTASNEGPDIILNEIVNVGEDHTIGLEAFANLSLMKWWRNIIIADISHYKVEGEYMKGSDSENMEKYAFSTSSNNWTLRSISYFNLSKTTQFQLNLTYKSKSKWAQGEVDDTFLTTMTLKHSFFKRKLAASFIVRDVFNTADQRKTYNNEDFELINKFNRDAPTFKLSLSYKINNYKRSRRRRRTGL